MCENRFFFLFYSSFVLFVGTILKTNTDKRKSTSEHSHTQKKRRAKIYTYWTSFWKNLNIWLLLPQKEMVRKYGNVVHVFFKWLLECGTTRQRVTQKKRRKMKNFCIFFHTLDKFLAFSVYEKSVIFSSLSQNSKMALKKYINCNFHLGLVIFNKVNNFCGYWA